MRERTFGCIVEEVKYPMKARKRQKGSGIRIYVDQLEALSLLAAGKYKGHKSVKDLVREAVDEFLNRGQR
jgi:hypothetical protein